MGSAVAAATLVLLACCACAFAENDMKLVKLESSVPYGAMCLDGSPIAYYIRRNDSNPNWVVYFKGGGWCRSVEDCYERSLTSLGSSTSYPPTMTSAGILSNSAETNPYFFEWNAVYLMYCDGASWTGGAVEPAIVNNTKVWFRGHLGLDAVLHALVAEGMSSTGDLLLSGCSAGGLATYFHADYVAAWFPKYRVKAMAESGFFLNYTNIDGVAVYGQQMASVFTFQNSTGGVHPGCIAAHPGDEQQCFLAENTYPYIKTPFFALNSLYDQYQMECILTVSESTALCDAFSLWTACVAHPINCTSTQVEYLNSWRNTFVSRMTSAPTYSLSTSGAFLDSCVGHCAEEPLGSKNGLRDWSDMTIDGVDATHAVGDWFFGYSSTHKFVDCEFSTTYPFVCNPTCHQG
eukprot:m.622650 g.622650  ORF g.622650 m.622650 type:complete len:405 (-) comp58219_c1_seq10:195-1409(-)